MTSPLRSTTAALLALLAPSVVRAQDVARAPAYDASALLDHVRPSERAALASELGVDALDQLPLYDLHVAIDDQLRGFGLRESVVVTNTEVRPWREVVMRVFVNATVAPGRDPDVRFLEGRCLDGRSCGFEQSSPSVIVVRPDAPIAPGAQLRFELDLQGTMRELEDDRLTMMGQGLEGLAALEGTQASTPGDYGLVAHGGGIGSLAAFYPVLARRRGTRWVTDDGGTMGDLSTDAPHHVRARIVVPEEAVVASSGVEVSVADVADAPGRAPRKEITIHAAAVRELAILVSPRFVTQECTADGTRIRSFFLMRDQDAGRHVADVACAAFRVFTRRFGPYPYTELDVVEAPLVGGAGGVEFSGLVTVALMFYRGALDGGGGAAGMLGALGALGGGDGSDATAGLDGLAQMSASMREFVTAHEVAHQWWHGLVGSDSRAHPWVDESLAQYAAMLYVEDRHGAARAREEGERQVAMNYHMMRIQGLPDDVVDRPASAFGAPIAYAGLVYGKGPYFYGAVRERVGDDAFFAGLSRYVTEHRFREAGPGDVVDALAHESRGHEAEVRALARRWLHERHGDEDLGPSDGADVLRTMMPPELAAALDDPTMGPLLRQLMGSMLAGGGAGGGGGGEDGPDLGALLGGGEVDDDAIRARLGEIQGLGQTQATPTEPRDTQRPPAQRRGPAPRRLP
ncbi:MAG: M1 family aminopeptidase [Sandaracinus sp.]